MENEPCPIYHFVHRDVSLLRKNSYGTYLPKINMLRSFDEVMRNHMIDEGMEPHNILRYDYDVLTVRWTAMGAGAA